MNNILNPSSFSFSEIKTQLLKIVPAVGLSIFIALAGAGITVLAANATGNPIWKLAKDPA